MFINITAHKKDYIAATYYVPGELLSLFDVQAVYIERFAGFVAAWRMFESPAARAKTQGFPVGRCSYQALFHLIIEEGIIPKPVSFSALSYTCKDAWTYCRDEADRYNTPFYFIDVHKTTGSNQIIYLADQFKELYEKLKSIFPLRASIEEVVAASNKALEIKQEIDAFGMKNPESVNIIDSFKLFPLYNDLGKASTVEILKDFENKIKSKSVSDNQHDIPRILWHGIVPLYKNSLLREIEEKLECRVVGEEMFDFGNTKLSCDTFFEDLAKRIISSRFFTRESRIEAIFKGVKDLDIDGIIHFSHRNCGFLPPLVPLIKNKSKEQKIPFVEIKGDVVDPAYFDEEQMWEKLKPFYELIHGSK
ncbi:MAG: 2-hydroxyacyl-CoA dehydratase family protein [Dysgonamonadaceae bacterium]|nr:2-hydroxyacyl-CoA dehydratase family protein [Dysgonamonadaceae bacterium]